MKCTTCEEIFTTKETIDAHTDANPTHDEYVETEHKVKLILK